MQECLKTQESVIFQMNVPVKLQNIYGILRLLREQYPSAPDGSPRFTTDQLVLFNKNPLYSTDSNINLEYLSEILSLVNNLGDSYHVYYQYVRGNEQDYGPFLWPYYILMPGKIFFLSADCKSGYLEDSPELVNLAHQTFRNRIQNAPRLFQVYTDYAKAFHAYCSNFQNFGLPVYTMENAPCMALMYDEETLGLLTSRLPADFAPLILEAKKFYELTGSQPMTTEMFFSMEGLQLFLKEGVPIGGIAVFLDAIPEELRRPMLRRFLQNQKAQNVQVHILNSTELPLTYPLMMEFFAPPRKISLFLLNPQKQILYIEISEDSVCEAFLDFMAHLEDLKLACSSEETEARILDALSE